jgi:hypothetical protein
LDNLKSLDPQLAAWVETREGVFDLVLELRVASVQYPINKQFSSKRTLELWEKMAPRLPKEDILRQRTCWAVVRAAGDADPAKAAEIDQQQERPSWAAQYYRKAGRTADADRMQRVVADSFEREAAFRKETERFKKGEIDLNDWLGKQAVMKRIEFLTTGVDDAWSRQCDKGFSHFVASLPDNPRLRRIMTLYYSPCVEDNFNSRDGELNLAEPMLRTTAESFPDALGRTYRLLVEGGAGEASWSTGPTRIPGDWGPTGNALWMTADLLRTVPQAKSQILAVAKERAEALQNPIQRCRWRALIAFLEDPAPGDRRDWESLLPKKLRGSESERRWALAWVANELAEARGKPLEFHSPDVPKAVSEAAGKCATPEDKILACDAVKELPPPAGLDAVLEIAVQDVPLEVWRMAAAAIQQQHRRARQERGGSTYPAEPLPDFVNLLPALRKALYPHLREPQECQFVLTLLAELRDAELDAEMARQLLASKDPQFLPRCAVVAHDGLVSCEKTVSAIEELGRDASFAEAEWAARLAQELRNYETLRGH